MEKGLCAVVAAAGLTSSMAWANGLPLSNFALQNNGNPVNSSGGVFKSNVVVNSFTLGEKTFHLKGTDFHSPIAVKLFAQSDADAQRFVAVPDSQIDAPGSAFRFALSNDIEKIPGMTSLDVSQTSDFGRMLAPTGTRATQTQIFLPTPERDNNALADDKTPEVILMGAVPNGTIKVTPILAGTPDIPESLVFGRTLEIDPTIIAAGTTSVSTVTNGGSSPHRMCVIGLDLSGDLKVASGSTVVGYQLECPAGTNTPIKLMSVGTQESGVYASDAPALEAAALTSPDHPRELSYETFAQSPSLTPAPSSESTSLDAPGFADEEFAPEDRVYTQYIGPLFRLGQVGTPQAFPLPDFLASASAQPSAQSRGSDAGSQNLNPTPVVPAPGSIALIAAAAVAMNRRRKF
ncbi:MAG: hypothetical protein K8R92_05410 [Planctomycetes bacterium]|nr:hypothetical protein [Planctomycetota bacterium]